MVNNEKNKYENVILTKQIEDFVEHLSIEKNYAINTISSYKRDLLKFSSFLEVREFSDFNLIDSDVLNLFVMELRHRSTSGKSIKRYLSSIRVFFTFLIDNNQIEVNPALAIKLQKLSEIFQKPLILMI